MKVSVVGGGNAGVLTILYLSLYVKNVELELIYNPEIPSEPVGQGTLLTPPALLWSSLGFNWYNNPIHATFKSGILYEGWGKLNDEVFHDFATNSMSMHYCPGEMQKYALESGLFKVIEGDVDPKDVDADYIFDCRGKPEDYSEYDDLINPLNSVILSRKEGRDLELNYTRCVATPHGWTFVIPNHDSVSYGYLYNDKITLKNIAEDNFIDLFDVVPDGYLKFKNYIAKSMWRGERTILNGNRLCFLEPLEATSVGFYQTVCSSAFKTMTKGIGKEESNHLMRTEMKEIQNFVLWHYQTGSKYDTPFWDYAKSLEFGYDRKFNQFLDISRRYKYDKLRFALGEEYGQWSYINFKNWDELTMKK